MRFQRWFERCECVPLSNFTKETVPDRQCRIRKRSLTKRVYAYIQKTKNGSIRSALPAGWFVNFWEFSQTDMKGLDSCSIQKQICAVFVQDDKIWSILATLRTRQAALF